jgi:hypothetical protein
MTPTALLYLAQLLAAAGDAPSPVPDGPILTRDFARLTPLTASRLDGRPVRASFVVKGVPPARFDPARGFVALVMAEGRMTRGGPPGWSRSRHTT